MQKKENLKLRIIRKYENGARWGGGRHSPKTVEKMTKNDEIYQKYTKNCHVLEKIFKNSTKFAITVEIFEKSSVFSC